MTEALRQEAMDMNRHVVAQREHLIKSISHTKLLLPGFRLPKEPTAQDIPPVPQDDQFLKSHLEILRVFISNLNQKIVYVEAHFGRACDAAWGFP
jgi:hypothetical protein